MSDQEIVQSIQTGGTAEDKALDYLYNHDILRGDAKKIFAGFRNIKLKSWLDIFHDSLIQLVKSIKLNKYNGDSKITIYLLGIYRNKCRENLRLETGKRATLEIPPDKTTDLQSPLDLILGKDLKNQLRTALEQLDEKCKSILTLWADNQSMKDIASQLSISNEQVAKTYKLRCKKKLIKIIASDPKIERALNEYRWI